MRLTPLCRLVSVASHIHAKQKCTMQIKGAPGITMLSILLLCPLRLTALPPAAVLSTDVHSTSSALPPQVQSGFAIAIAEACEMSWMW